MANLRNEVVIYDFETLSQDTENGIVVSFAAMCYDETRFVDNPYTFEELLELTREIKFDIQEQKEVYGRTVQQSTLDWWMKQGVEAKRALLPSKEDKPISELYDFCLGVCKKPKAVYARGNTFDPLFVTGITKATGKPEPWDWWLVRDTRSFIEGATIGCDVKNDFTPPGCEGFIHHNPSHDIVIDVMRMQYIINKLL